MGLISLHLSTNKSSINRTINTSVQSIGNSTRKLSSGVRVNKAGDDSAALSVAAKIESQLKGINKAQQNTLEVLSVLDIAESGLNKTVDNIQRIRELYIQGANGTNSVDEKMHYKEK